MSIPSSAIASRLSMGTRTTLICAILACAAPACSTFGVESEDHILTAESRAPGVELFQIDGMATDDVVQIRGGAALFQGVMRVTGWFRPGQDHDIFSAISLYFDSDGATLTPRTLFHSIEAEHITVRDATFDVPADLEVWVDSAAGDVAVDLIDRDVTVHAQRGVAVSNIGGTAVVDTSGAIVAESVDGPVFLDGTSINVRNTGPVEINATGEVSATIGYGGSISAGTLGNVTVDVTDSAFDTLFIDAQSGDVSVYLPSAPGWVIVIEGGHTADDEDDDSLDEDGRVIVDVGDVYFDADGYVSDEFTVGAGGPTIHIQGGVDISVYGP